MKEFVLYTGCTTPVRLPAYEAAVTVVLEKLGVRLIPMKDVNCCGAQYIESLSHTAFAAMSGRILAIAESMDRDILAICGACSGSLKAVKHDLDSNKVLRAEVNELLADEGLKYTGTVEVKHLLQIFNEDIGYDAIKAAIVKPYHGVRLAAHYGCHVTRPPEIVHVDDPENPVIIDTIIEAAGATPVDYVGKTRCCGGPMLAMDEEVANKIGLDKIKNIRDEKADGIVTACVFCDIQLTQVQFGDMAGDEPKIPVLTLPQFLGPAMGINFDSLGIQLNKIDPQAILQEM
ncbi:MAG: CoB--CoM heterodisulfide reductase iron-sulfur subunit B family protein [Candidatus Thorarchaeota archaeon]|nr:CoB--CoM heterodisulfide reductase iron-sulfur subunit B family protein [Candidatus Thorarchaeota archaeon]